MTTATVIEALGTRDHSVSAERATTSRARPALARSAERALVALTAQPLVRGRPDLCAGLAAARFDIRYVATWDRLLEGAERIPADVILVDMDDAQRACLSARSVSGRRLVTLLARRTASQPVALVTLTRLDYAEIEDLGRAGVTAFLAPSLSAKALVAYTVAALQRERWRHSRRASPHLGATELSPAERPGEATRDGDATREPAGETPDPHADEAALAALPDALWARIESLLAAQPRQPGRRAPRVSDRQVCAALLYLLRSGRGVGELPRALGAASTVRVRLRAWAAAGALDALSALLTGEGADIPSAHWSRLLATLTGRAG